MASRKRNNIPGAAEQPLRSVKARNKAGQYKVDSSSKEASSYNEIIRSVVEEIRVAQADSGNYSRDMLSKSIDNILDRVVYELDSRQDSQKFTDSQLTSIKEKVAEALEEQSLSYADMSAMKDDILSVVGALTGNEQQESESDNEAGPSQSAKPITFADKLVESTEDEAVDAKPGSSKTTYRDSTIAQDFAILQNFINEQFRLLDENLKNMPGGFMPKLSLMLSAGFGKIMSGVGGFAKMTAKLAKNTFGRVAGISKAIGGGVMSGISKAISGLRRGIGSVIGGIKGLGSKVGAALSSPFKAIGGFFSKLNPFSRSKKEDKAAKKKEALREKLFAFMGKILDKIWKLVEPFIGWVSKVLKTYVIIPVTLIALKIGLIIAGIVALGVLAYIAVKWVVAKVKKFWNYIVSGEMWEDIKESLVSAWEWLKDFGSWLWDIICDGVKYIFCGMWVDLGKWIWDKLCEFGKWLYDKYIDPYVIQPLAKLIQPIANLWVEKIQPAIQPFIDSLTNLKDRIVSIWQKFQWDENKSFFENLKCLASIVKDAVLNWWNESPFKTFYEEHLKKFVDDIKAFVERIKNAFAQWDTNKSIWENLKNIGGIIKDSIKEWWEKSSIKVAYDTYIKPIVDKIQSVVIDAINKLSDMVWSLPVIGTFRPFGFLAGKEFFLSEAEEKEYKEVTEKRDQAKDIGDDLKELKALRDKGEKDLSYFSNPILKAKYGSGNLDDIIKDAEAKQAKLNAEANAASSKIEKTRMETAMSQVAPAMDSLNNVQEAKQAAQAELSKEAKLYSAEAAQKQEQQEQLGQSQDNKLNTIIDIVNNINSKPGANVNTDEIAAAAMSGATAGGAAGSVNRNGFMMENR